MRVVILAGGVGARLRPLTYTIPKPLLPVGDVPILEVILRKLKSFGFVDFILAVGYRSELIETYFQDGARFSVNISYVREKQLLGTAAPLALVREEFSFEPGETFLLMNGDILTKMDFSHFIEYHNRRGAEITVACRRHENRLPLGILYLDGENKVTQIVEKPVTVYNASAGIYAMKSSVLKDIPPLGCPFDMPDLIQKLVLEERKVVAYPFDEYWLAVEELHDIAKACEDIDKWQG